MDQCDIHQIVIANNVSAVSRLEEMAVAPGNGNDRWQREPKNRKQREMAL